MSVTLFEMVPIYYLKFDEIRIKITGWAHLMIATLISFRPLLELTELAITAGYANIAGVRCTTWRNSAMLLMVRINSFAFHIYIDFLNIFSFLFFFSCRNFHPLSTCHASGFGNRGSSETQKVSVPPKIDASSITSGSASAS